MKHARSCRKPGCENPAVATLTSDYADCTIVIGPLATERQPEAYDLCDKHVASFTAPRGWQIIRLADSFAPAPPSADDLLALADAVRNASRNPRPRPQPAQRSPRPSGILPPPFSAASSPEIPFGVGAAEIARKGHLRVLRGEKED